MTLKLLFYRIDMRQNIHDLSFLPTSHTGACTGFDRDLEDGEAIRRLMRQITNLKLNANDNYELAAA